MPELRPAPLPLPTDPAAVQQWLRRYQFVCWYFSGEWLPLPDDPWHRSEWLYAYGALRCQVVGQSRYLTGAADWALPWHPVLPLPGGRLAANTLSVEAALDLTMAQAPAQARNEGLRQQAIADAQARYEAADAVLDPPALRTRAPQGTEAP